MLDPEEERRIILRRAGLDEEGVYGPTRIARALGLGVGFYPHHVLRGLDAMRFFPRGRSHPPEIALRRGMTPTRRAFCLLHEIAEDHLDRIGYREPDVERMANAIAASLQMPARLFREVVREGSPEELSRISGEFLSSQTSVALRLAEVGEVEVSVVVTPHLVYARAPSGFVLPAEQELRRMVRGVVHLGLRRVEITDERRRVALIA